jgi:NADPH-dependent 2,4-dienoyl-CoA reductase/sulfur reductase-like enzyme
MRDVALLVCGGGPAALSAARGYRDAGGDGAVLVASDDELRPYARPPLSKDYVRGDAQAEDLPLEDDEWYAAQRVELRLQTTVRDLDPGARTAVVGDEPVRYGACVLATGAEPARLPVPGGDDERIHLLRAFAQGRALREASEVAESALVVGSGFIGCELAASLAMRGLRVALASDERVPQEARLGAEVGERIAGWLRELGVDLRLGSAVARFDDAAVVLEDGTELAAELVVMGAGVRPRADVAEAAGLSLERGRVPVDASMRTAADGLFAAGDVALAENRAAGRRLVVEHWGEALRMGEIAGKVAAGADDAWHQVPGFFSKIGTRQLKYAAWGDGYDAAELVPHDTDAFAVWYGRDGRLVGVLAHRHDEAYERGRELIEAGAAYDERPTI